MQERLWIGLTPVVSPRSRLPELKAFGAMLRQLRGDRSRQQIALRLKDLGVPLDESTLVQYEKGTVWSPDAGVLRGLGEIYGVPLDTIVGLLRENRMNPTATDWRGLIIPPSATTTPPGWRSPIDVIEKPSASRYVTRALRLLELMSEKGQKVAVENLAAFARAYPREQPQEQPLRLARKSSAKASKVRGTR